MLTSVSLRLLFAGLLLAVAACESGSGGGSAASAPVQDRANSPAPAPSSSVAADEKITQPWYATGYCPFVRHYLWIFEDGTASYDGRLVNWVPTKNDVIWLGGDILTFQIVNSGTSDQLELTAQSGEKCELLAVGSREELSDNYSGILGSWKLTPASNGAPGCGKEPRDMTEVGVLHTVHVISFGFYGEPHLFDFEKGQGSWPEAIRVYSRNGSEVLEYRIRDRYEGSPLMQLHKRGDPDTAACEYQKKIVDRQ